MIVDKKTHRSAEQALRESEVRFRSTFEQAAVGIAHVAPDGQFLRVNRKFCEIAGYSEYEMLQQTFQDITYPDDLDTDLELMQQLLNEEITTYSLEKRYSHPDGKLVWVNLTVSLIKDHARHEKWFVSVIQDISERKQAEQAILDYQHRLRELAAELARAEERERRKIAMELHDHIGQSLAVMRLQLAAARKETAGRKVDSILDDVSESLRAAIQDTRNIISDISFPTLNELGLSAAIAEWLSEEIEERYGLQTRFSIDGKPKSLSEDVKAILFRCVRELLINVVKHAKASQVTVSIHCEGNAVTIVVEDDGVGLTDTMRATGTSDIKGFGLFSIEESMSDLGGSLVIEGRPGKGVVATLTAPIELD